DQDGDGDEDAAHGRRSRLLLVRLRTLFADELPELDAPHPLDQPRTEDEGDEQRGERGPGRAEGDVAEDVESGDDAAERGKEVVEHYFAPSRLPVACCLLPEVFSGNWQPATGNSFSSIVTILSNPIPREAFTSTKSPGRMKSLRNAAADSASSKWCIRSPAKPALRAPSSSDVERGPTPTTTSMARGTAS